LHCFRLLIDPGEPIPASATQIHGIDDTSVARAPSFAQVWPDVSQRLAAPVVIGHAIGFDIAVLKREAARAGVTWRPPRTLCTRLLAQAAAPNLGGYSLEHLASWLDVQLTGRHSAVGDAITTARIFLALLPKLRERNIRTLAEAEQACRAQSNVLEDQQRAGWEEGVSRAQPRRPLGPIDIYPYRHRVADVMSTPVQSIGVMESLSDAL
jgi:DNA polymerase-3 subunit epsilon/CBS domain-containing protein